MTHRRFSALALIAACATAFAAVSVPAAAAGANPSSPVNALHAASTLAPTIDVPTTRLDIWPTSTALAPGQSLTFNAYYDSGDARPENLTWRSSDSSVLTVSATGTLNAISPGEATITVTDKNDATLTNTATISVREVSEDAGIELSVSDVTRMVGTHAFVNALLAPSLQGREVTWSLSPASLGTTYPVDSDSATGFRAADEAGSGTLTALVSDEAGQTKSVTVPVTVEPDLRGDFLTNDEGVLVTYRGTSKDIVIPEGVTGIASGFSTTSLDSAWIPASVRYIDYRAFYGTGLKQITFQDDEEHPSQLTDIYSEAFSRTDVETMVLPRSVRTIIDPFEDMAHLKTLRLGPNVAADQMVGAFRYTPSLTSIEVDPASTNYTSDAGVLYTKDRSRLIAYPSAKNPGGAYTVLEGTTRIEDSAFEDAKVSSVTLPSTLRTIGSYAFEHSQLTELTLPDGFEKAGTWAFAYTNQLTRVDLGGATELPSGAFIYATSLTEVNFRSDLARLTRIGESAFQEASLSSVILPDSVTSIGASAFAKNRMLRSLHLGAGITSIESLALGGLSALTDLSVSPDNPTFFARDDVLYQRAGSGTRLSLYLQTKSQKEFTVPAGTTEIGQWAFQGNQFLKRVVLPDGLTTISNGAFYGCLNLTDVSFPESLSVIRGMQNTGLDTLELGTQVRELWLPTRENRAPRHIIVRGGVNGEYYTDGEPSNGRVESAFFGEGMTTIDVRSKGPKVLVLPSTVTTFQLDPFSSKGFKTDTQVYVAAAEGSPAWEVAKAELIKEDIDLSHLHVYEPASISLSGTGIGEAGDGYAWKGRLGTPVDFTASVSAGVPDGRQLRVVQVGADGTESVVQDWTAMTAGAAASTLNVSWTPVGVPARLRIDTRDVTHVVRSTTLSVSESPAPPQPNAGTWTWGERGWRYVYPDGTYPANEKLVIDDLVYRFDEAGYARIGWVREGDRWYFHWASGVQASGWVCDGTSWYYLSPDTGAMATGWLKDGDSWYYLNTDSGAIVTGWLRDGGDWYYLRPDSGRMASGWLKDGDDWYYLRPGSGRMAVGRVWIIWRWYTFADDGRWIR